MDEYLPNLLVTGCARRGADRRYGGQRDSEGATADCQRKTQKNTGI